MVNYFGKKYVTIKNILTFIKLVFAPLCSKNDIYKYFGLYK